RQDSDFRYLTAFPEPDCIAVLAPGRKHGGRRAEYVLFVRSRNPEREIWDGRRAGPEGAMQMYGADAAYPIEAFDEQLPSLLAGRTRVHYTMGEHLEWDGRIAACVRTIREVSRRGAAAPTDFVALEASLHEMRLCKTPAELA